MRTREYLDEVRRALGLPSDNQAAIRIGVTPASVSAWRNGRGTMGTAEAVKVAQLLGMNPGVVLCDTHAERAERAGELELAQAWRQAADKLRASEAPRPSLAWHPSARQASRPMVWTVAPRQDGASVRLCIM